jgi:hypothetical protein
MSLKDIRPKWPVFKLVSPVPGKSTLRDALLVALEDSSEAARTLMQRLSADDPFVLYFSLNLNGEAWLNQD